MLPNIGEGFFLLQVFRCSQLFEHFKHGWHGDDLVLFGFVFVVIAHEERLLHLAEGLRGHTSIQQGLQPNQALQPVAGVPVLFEFVRCLIFPVFTSDNHPAQIQAPWIGEQAGAGVLYLNIGRISNEACKFGVAGSEQYRESAAGRSTHEDHFLPKMLPDTQGPRCGIEQAIG